MKMSFGKIHTVSRVIKPVQSMRLEPHVYTDNNTCGGRGYAWPPAKSIHAKVGIMAIENSTVQNRRASQRWKHKNRRASQRWKIQLAMDVLDQK